MTIKLLIGLSIFLFLSLFLLSNNNQSPREKHIPFKDPQNECERMGGMWKMFSNSCVDSCDLVKNTELLCAQVITDSCECGAYKCWNGKTCESHKSYPTQEQCELEEGCKCVDISCDYIPKDKTFDETCGVGFKAGWTCNYA